MARDGSIADVAVATMLCVCVAYPHRCGLGGGFFATYYNRKNRTALAFNAREMAPSAATSDMYYRNSTPSVFGEFFGEPTRRIYSRLLRKTALKKAVA